MRFRKFNILLICSASALLTACDIYESVPLFERIEKTPIELSVGGVDASTFSEDADGMAQSRAVVTNGQDKTLKPFDVNTKIFMVMKSEYGTEDFSDPDNPHVAKYTVARGDVDANTNAVVFDATNQRYWDDAHARSTQLDIWAYAQKGMSRKECTFEVPNTGGTGIDAYKDHKYNTAEFPSPVWSKGTTGEIYPAIRTWRASHHFDDGGVQYRQDATSVMCQDLLFSNNLTNNPVYNPASNDLDKRLKFDFTNRKFPQVGKAQMIFYHAMSKITIHIKKGEGFTASDPFAFTTGNVKLMGFNTEGIFNIKTGQFEYIHQHYDIPEIYKWNTPADGDNYTLEALVIPNIDGNVGGQSDTYSRLVDNATTKSMEFIIDNNKYELSQDQLYEALKANTANNAIVADGKVDFEAGKNYIFTFTIGKTKINHITAQVAEWEDVTAEGLSPTNARIKLQLEERGDAVTSEARFYRAADDNSGDINDDYTSYNWKAGYNDMNATYNSDAKQWSTNLFWESNKNFYHFRALMPDATTVTQESSEGDYVTLASGSTYTDVRWGAPMLDVADNTVSDASTLKWLYGPTTNGFDAKDDGTVASGLPTGTQHQIYKAIGPTKDAVKLILFHMMSDLTFNITTTTDEDRINLGDGNTSKPIVEILGYYNGGKVLLGNGLVQVTGDKGNISVVQKSFTAATSSDAPKCVYVFGVVPQELDGIQLRITTPDNNRYIVDLKDIIATTVTSANLSNPYKQENGKFIIDRWYPGYKYVYNLTLKKKGQVDFKATIVDWETVTVDNENVQIK